MPTIQSSELTARLRYCGNCARPLLMASLEYWEYAGRIHLFCSERCYDRFTVDPVRRLIASPVGES